MSGNGMHTTELRAPRVGEVWTSHMAIRPTITIRFVDAHGWYGHTNTGTPISGTAETLNRCWDPPKPVLLPIPEGTFPMWYYVPAPGNGGSLETALRFAADLEAIIRIDGVGRYGRIIGEQVR